VARPEARVLCWLCEPDEFAMIDAFVATEDEPDIARTEDLFVPLDAPFAAAATAQRFWPNSPRRRRPCTRDWRTSP